MDTKFATSFSPYTPPPDENQQDGKQPAVTNTSYGAAQSYQSGGIPSFGSSQPGITGFGNTRSDEERGVSNLWQTRYGWRVDVVAASAYLLGPISALLLLVLETSNDYVRFHAYQSALLSTPLLLIRIFMALVGFWHFLQTLMTIALVVCCVGMAVQAYRDANQGGLTRFRLPWIGQLADRWVGEE